MTPIERQYQAALVAADLIKATGCPGVGWEVPASGGSPIDLWIHIPRGAGTTAERLKVLRSIPLEESTVERKTERLASRTGSTDGIAVYAWTVIEKEPL